MIAGRLMKKFMKTAKIKKFYDNIERILETEEFVPIVV